jgi:Carboxypeptidase regulatory-like domain
VAEQTLLGLLTRSVDFSSTAFWAHIGGFVTGVGATLVLLSVFPGIRTRGEQPFMVRYLKGDVHDMNGNALANARFEMQPDSGEPIAATANSNGRFEVGRLPDGCYSFTVSKEGWLAVRGNIVVRKKTRHNMPIKIQMSQQQTNNVVTPERAGVRQR